MEFNTPVVVVMEIYMELEIMIWIFVVCEDYGDDGDTMIVCSNIYLREDGE